MQTPGIRAGSAPPTARGAIEVVGRLTGDRVMVRAHRFVVAFAASVGAVPGVRQIWNAIGDWLLE